MGARTDSPGQRLAALIAGVVRMPMWFAVLVQGGTGALQLVAFLVLTGKAYLEFSFSFLVGNVAALLLVLNFENRLLAGRSSAVLVRYAGGIWLAGVGSILAELAMGRGVPGPIAFASITACSRLCMAWANQAKPSLAGMAGAAVVVILACLSGHVAVAALGVLGALLIVVWRSSATHQMEKLRFWRLWVDSVREFAAYLPHTAAGLGIAYFDRYLALVVVGGGTAESYLRTVQMVSWATFLVFPVVFQLRRQTLQRGGASTAWATTVALLTGTSILVAVAAVYVAISWVAGTGPVPWTGLALILAGAICAQCYQVFSTLNFVRERFATINSITLISGGVAVLTGLVLVPLRPNVESLSLVFFAGWLVQLSLTLRALRQSSS